MTGLFKLTYGAAHAGKLAYWLASDLLFAFFLTEVCGLTPREMGLSLGISMIANAVADIAFGKMFSRQMRDTAMAARFQALGAMICGLCLLVFVCCPYIDASLRFVYALISLTAFRVSYTLYDQPQNILMALTTRNDGEKASFAALRFLWGGGVRIMMALAFVPLLVNRPISDVARDFGLFLAGIVVVGCVTALSLAQCLRRPQPLSAETGPADAPKSDLTVSKTGPGWPVWRLFALIFVASGLISVWYKLVPYFAGYVLIERSDAATVMTCLMIGGMASQFFWDWLGQRFTLTQVLATALLAQITSGLLFVVLVRQGSGGALVGSLVVGAANGGIGLALWALMASVAAFVEPETPGSLVAGAFSSASKVGHAMAYGLAALALQLEDYRQVKTGIYTLELAMMLSLILGCTVMLGLIKVGIRPGVKQSKPV